MSNEQVKPLTVNDIIHGDERTIQLKKEYNEYAQAKNNAILDISRVEADIIKEIGAVEYVESLLVGEQNISAPDLELVESLKNEKARLVAKFNQLILDKSKWITFIALQDKNMEGCTERFNKLADSIVEELKATAKRMQEGINVPAEQSAPDHSAPDGRVDVTVCPETLHIEAGGQATDQPNGVVTENNGETIPGPEGQR